MIDDKKIKSAAQGYCDATYDTLNEHPLIAEAFEQGAKWVINEFLKDLWHPISEKPRRNTTYLVQIRDCIFDTFYDSAEWEIFVKGCNITRWLYIDDLLLKITEATHYA